MLELPPEVSALGDLHVELRRAGHDRGAGERRTVARGATGLREAVYWGTKEPAGASSAAPRSAGSSALAVPSNVSTSGPRVAWSARHARFKGWSFWRSTMSRRPIT